MDLWLLLITEPSSSSQQDRIARSMAMRSVSTDRTHSTHPTFSLDSTATQLSIGSSFSYMPLPDDSHSREAEYDYAAAHEYTNSVDSGSDTDEPETPSLDYMGTGTPLFTPRLMTKILQAKAAGRPFQVRNSNVGEGGDKAQTKSSSNGRNRSVSIAFPAVSDRHWKLQGGEGASVRGKRNREEKSDDEPYMTNTGPDSDASSTSTANEPPFKRPRAWKGWALVEVSSSEDDTPGAKLYDDNGRRIDSCSSEPQSQNVKDSKIDSKAERVKSKPGWKGWALVTDPPDQSKLIKLDAPPLILTTRATRSGRTFGDESGWRYSRDFS
ncbi:hypothetical protein M407DRAFT_26904 [Tulasnella calospora MUT 4182]|uniref:Uncharacterized protein n=1 Tax=Tulasnella calospora MUT 4182 TaxID=1051891 RepID=A0A0C3QDE1_9AGAM|nr:hypothetical protein M407DRAFT_26904 [Tulasnella calospora MUT 4182]